jgi:hypothetical protein
MLAAVFLAAALVCGAAPARAYNVIGGGVDSCGTWTADRGAYVPGGPATQGGQAALQDVQWVLGFLSGVSMMGALTPKPVKPFNNVDADGVLAWIDNYCRARPLEMIVDAANAFITAHPH